MAYKYLAARLTAGDLRTPRQSWLDDYQQLVSLEFENSPTYYSISEEYPVGTETYRTTGVRIVHAINNKVGINMGDDWKVIIFEDLSYNAMVGTLYQFDSNTWLSVSTERIKGITTSCLVRRCNNVLRWMETDGSIYQVPCVIDYPIRENRDYATAGSALVTPSGMIEVYVPYNSKSNRIRPNQRFLFGNASNWTAYKVMGGGVNNYANQQTTVNTSSGFIRLTMGTNYVNDETDDLTNGIADAVEATYTLSISQAAITVQTTKTFQLLATVYKNGQIDGDASVTWSTSNALKATVSAAGLVTGVAAGTCVVTCTLANNTAISDTVNVTVQTGAPASVYEIRITPNNNVVLEGQTVTFTATLYKDGASQADTFAFSIVSSSVPTYHYLFNALTGNTFSIFNSQKFIGDAVTVRCFVAGKATLDYDIYLSGAW